MLTVIMPVHNLNGYVNKAMESLMNQDIEDFEVLVLINGPEHKKLKVLESGCKDNRFSFYYIEMPGLSNALNFGLEKANFEIVVRMDSDDISCKSRLRRILEEFNSDPSISVLASGYSIIDENDRLLETNKSGKLAPEKIRNILPYRCVIAHPTVAYRRQDIVDVGGYSFGVFSEDYDLWLRLRRRQNARFKMIPESLLLYRVHKNQITNFKNYYNLFVFDFILKIRELLITKEWRYFFGIGCTFADLGYRMLKFYSKQIVDKCRSIKK